MLLHRSCWGMASEKCPRKGLKFWRSEILKGAVCLLSSLLLHEQDMLDKASLLLWSTQWCYWLRSTFLCYQFWSTTHLSPQVWCAVFFCFKLNSISFIWILFLLKVPLLLQHSSVSRETNPSWSLYHFWLRFCDAFKSLWENYLIVAKWSVCWIWRQNLTDSLKARTKKCFCMVTSW